LAGESGRQEIAGWQGIECGYVRVNRHSRQSLFEDAARRLIDLAEELGLVPRRSEANLDAPDTSEETDDAQFRLLLLRWHVGQSIRGSGGIEHMFA
jgi:hypothetical protein